MIPAVGEQYHLCIGGTRLKPLFSSALGLNKKNTTKMSEHCYTHTPTHLWGGTAQFH